jgi:hypothetical protein
VGWWHWVCLDIREAPDGIWICPKCIAEKESKPFTFPTKPEGMPLRLRTVQERPDEAEEQDYEESPKVTPGKRIRSAKSTPDKRRKVFGED